VQANELVIKIAESQTVIDMSLGPDAQTTGHRLGQRSSRPRREAENHSRRHRSPQENNDGNGAKRNAAAAQSNGRQSAAAAAPNKIRWCSACEKNSAPKFEP
jgi:hypothetical protein